MILLVVGVTLAILGATGRAIGGRAHWYRHPAGFDNRRAAGTCHTCVEIPAAVTAEKAVPYDDWCRTKDMTRSVGIGTPPPGTDRIR